MSQENTRAQGIAIEALIAASLRVPDEETEVTQEEISRFANQHVTLSPEEEAALEKNKPQFMQAIAEVLRGKERIDHSCTCQPPEVENMQFAAMNRKNTNNEFSVLTESELDRKRREMIERIKIKKSGSNS